MKITFPFDLDKVKAWLLGDKKHLYTVLGLAACFILVILLVCCTAGNQASEPFLRTVAVDALDVHKKADAGSRVLGQLPEDLEIEILEEKTVKETSWGRIDATTLPDGQKVKGGWIDLQYVRLPGEIEILPTELDTEPEPQPVAVEANMGTVTAGKLNIRKGPDSKYETDGAYYEGDRIEILETQTADDTVWGRTNLGWIGMGWVRMDGTPVEGPAGLISNGNAEVLGYGVVNLGELNVRLGPGTEYDKIGTVKLGLRYPYYQVSSTTDNWVRIENGWVSTDYFYLEGTRTADAFTGTVTTDDLNIRTGPDTSFKSVGTYMEGDQVEILVQVGRWGYCDQGWVFMTYVEANAPTYSTGECTVTRGLNIRQEPNADSEKVGELVEGNVVTILEVDGNWGRIVQGWINLKYVEYNSVG